MGTATQGSGNTPARNRRGPVPGGDGPQVLGLFAPEFVALEEADAERAVAALAELLARRRERAGSNP
ncbi:MAG TPA: hypothetical protein VEH82_05540 [Acidimicrobiales bacterium]|nr:hypothetical protein [Acidimicrobiales bacterium]